MTLSRKVAIEIIRGWQNNLSFQELSDEAKKEIRANCGYVNYHVLIRVKLAQGCKAANDFLWDKKEVSALNFLMKHGFSCERSREENEFRKLKTETNYAEKKGRAFKQIGNILYADSRLSNQWKVCK